ncbi:tyrosine-protein phosphatase [Amycolatopsis keratiniphila]|uniref:tyrosine-protein phosphatase n=1 Tax=Amycolatopsis keratiniphila TaxID=129921 RepID=UPI001E50889D|nr:tyrosine-protein phosphatase [Amycolatopsis keratiniphila]
MQHRRSWRLADQVGPCDSLRRLLQGGRSSFRHRLFLERKASRCAAVFTALADCRPGGVLFHCGANRDRTGLISLPLLALADIRKRILKSEYT